jgi:nucleoside-diphosphate-sugar epimerase
VHVEDLADLFVLALNKAQGGQLFHAGAESRLRTRDIAKAVSTSIGLGGKTMELGIPDLGEALGMPPMAHYWASNSQSSSEKARRLLDWRPAHLQMLVDIETHGNQ